MGLTEHTSMEACFWSKQSYVEILSYYKITSWITSEGVWVFQDVR